MLINLPSGFEAGAQGGDVFDSVLQKVSDGPQAAVSVIAVNDHFAVLIRACDKFQLWLAEPLSITRRVPTLG